MVATKRRASYPSLDATTDLKYTFLLLSLGCSSPIRRYELITTVWLCWEQISRTAKRTSGAPQPGARTCHQKPRSHTKNLNFNQCCLCNKNHQEGHTTYANKACSGRSSNQDRLCAPSQSSLQSCAVVSFRVGRSLGLPLSIEQLLSGSKSLGCFD